MDKWRAGRFILMVLFRALCTFYWNLYFKKYWGRGDRTSGKRVFLVAKLLLPDPPCLASTENTGLPHSVQSPLWNTKALYQNSWVRGSSCQRTIFHWQNQEPCVCVWIFCGRIPIFPNIPPSREQGNVFPIETTFYFILSRGFEITFFQILTLSLINYTIFYAPVKKADAYKAI